MSQQQGGVTTLDPAAYELTGNFGEWIQIRYEGKIHSFTGQIENSFAPRYNVYYEPIPPFHYIVRSNLINQSNKYNVPDNPIRCFISGASNGVRLTSISRIAIVSHAD